jgi:Tol biopolymer transport system component/DNA-binding winged helix-turn-helix (wHTH) protein
MAGAGTLPESTAPPSEGNVGSKKRFGVFEFDPLTGELTKHGVSLRVQDQPIQILLALLEQPGRIVAREELQRRLWPDGTFVDFEQSLNKAVNKLREALGDSASHPLYIETVARRGYRFVAPVSSEPEKAPPRQETPPPSASVARRMWPTVALFALPATLVAVWLARWLGAPVAPDLRVSPLTTYPGHQLQPSFSPDGTRVAFSWGGSDARNSDIYVKLIGPGDPVRLTTDPAPDFSPTWSPDGRWIAALRDRGGEFAVMLIPASGGPQKEVTHLNVEEPVGGACTLGVQQSTCAALFYGPTLVWSPDGKTLFTSARATPKSPLAIIRINIETGEQEVLTTPPPAIVGDLNPAVSPDGRALAFLRTNGLATSDIYVAPLSVEAPTPAKTRRLTSEEMDGAGLPAWAPDGSDLIFSSNRSGRRELWRLPVSSSGGPVRVPWSSEGAMDVAVSPRGNRLVYGRQTHSASLWKIPIESSRGREPVRVTATTRRDQFPDYSPDGKRIVFQSDRSGINEIWVCDADGSNAMQVTSFGKGWSGSPRWSPDGRTIAFDSNVEGNWDIWAIRSEGGRPVRLTRNPADDFIPSWSHDGNWIYFSSRRTGRLEIWKIRQDGSASTQVSTGGGYVADESADGLDLYYKDLGEAPLWRIPREGGAPTKVIDLVRGRVFNATPNGIYFLAGPAAAELRYFDFASTAVRVVANVGTPGGSVNNGGPAISPDGRWALYSRNENSGTNLMLVENFR